MSNRNRKAKGTVKPSVLREAKEFGRSASAMVVKLRQQLEAMTLQRNVMEAFLNQNRTWLAALIYQAGDELLITHETVKAMDGKAFTLRQMQDEYGVHIDMEIVEDVVEAEVVE